MVFDIEVYPEMPRKKSKAIPEGNDLVLQDTSGLLSGLTLEEIRRMMSEADQVKREDSCSAKRIDVGTTSSTSFGMTAEPPAFPRSDNVLVDKGVGAPKPCLPPV